MNEPACEFCGEPWYVDLFDCWLEDRAFLLEACCEASREEAEVILEEDSDAVRELFAGYGLNVRRLFDDGLGKLGLDYGHELGEIGQAEAFAFVADHHEHHEPPVGWKWGHAIRNGTDLVGVATVGRPVSRVLAARGYVEVTRVCVRRTLPEQLRKNACSMLYAAAVREARRRGHPRVISYTLETERGSSLAASGFVRVAKTRGGSWSSASRPRVDKAPTCPKWRWERAA